MATTPIVLFFRRIFSGLKLALGAIYFTYKLNVNSVLNMLKPYPPDL